MTRRISLFSHCLTIAGLDYKDSKADKGEMEKVASQLPEHHVFEVELENLLGAQGPVKHPRVLAKVIPNQICRCMNNCDPFFSFCCFSQGMALWGKNETLKILFLVRIEFLGGS